MPPSKPYTMISTRQALKIKLRNLFNLKPHKPKTPPAPPTPTPTNSESSESNCTAATTALASTIAAPIHDIFSAFNRVGDPMLNPDAAYRRNSYPMVYTRADFEKLYHDAGGAADDFRKAWKESHNAHEQAIEQIEELEPRLQKAERIVEEQKTRVQSMETAERSRQTVVVDLLGDLGRSEARVAELEGQLTEAEQKIRRKTGKIVELGRWGTACRSKCLNKISALAEMTAKAEGLEGLLAEARDTICDREMEVDTLQVTNQLCKQAMRELMAAHEKLKGQNNQMEGERAYEQQVLRAVQAKPWLPRWCFKAQIAELSLRMQMMVREGKAKDHVIRGLRVALEKAEGELGSDSSSASSRVVVQAERAAAVEIG